MATLPLQEYRHDGVLNATEIVPWPGAVDNNDKVAYPIVIAQVLRLPIRKTEWCRTFQDIAEPPKRKSDEVPVGWAWADHEWVPTEAWYTASKTAVALILPTKHTTTKYKGVVARAGENDLFWLLQALAGVVRSNASIRARAKQDKNSGTLDLTLELGKSAFIQVDNSAYTEDAGGSWKTHNKCFRQLLDQLAKWNALTDGPDSCNTTLNFLGGVKPPAVVHVAPLSSSEHEGDSAFSGSNDFSVGNILRSVASTAAPSEENPPTASRPNIAGLTTPLKKYQEEGIAWMVAREQRPNRLSLHPCWQQLQPPAPAPLVYAHRITGELSLQFPVVPEAGTCGGMLCDDVGLGKTLQVLGLLLAHPAPTSFFNPDDPAAVGPGQPEPVPPTLPVGSPARLGATLVVCPASLLSQWEEQIAKHAGGLRVCTYVGHAKARANLNRSHARRGLPQPEPAPADDDEGDGSRRRLRRRYRADAEESGSTLREEYEVEARTVPGLFRGPGGAVLEGGRVHEQQVVLAAYETLHQELRGSSHVDFAGSPLAQLAFWRIVLDEAQMVAASTSRAALMCAALWRSKAWVVTGTPIQAKVSEIAGLLSFLGHPVFKDEFLWKQLIEKPVLAKEPVGLHRLRSVLKPLMLRRLKSDPAVAAQLALPELRWEVRTISLTAPEKRTVEAASNQLQASYGEWRRAGAGSGPGRKMRLTARLNGDLTRLRQTICHPSVVNVDRQHGKVAANKQACKTRVEVLEEMVQRAQGERAGAVADHATASAADHAASILLLLQAGAVTEMAGGQTTEERLRALALELRSKLVAAGEGREGIRWEPTALRIEELAGAVGKAKALGQSGGKRSKQDEKRRAEVERGLGREVQSVFGKRWAEERRRAEVVAGRQKEAEEAEGRVTYFKQLLSDATDEARKRKLPAAEREEPEKRAKLSAGDDGGEEAEEGAEAMCPICLDVRGVEEAGQEWSLTECGHAFCFDCVSGLIDAAGGVSAPCPVCKAAITRTRVHRLVPVSEQGPAEEEGGAAGAGVDGEWGSKVCGLLAEVEQELAAGGKVLVFSAWTRLLRLAQSALEENGVCCVSLAGSLASKQTAIRAFTRPTSSTSEAGQANTPDVLLVPLFGGSSGGAGGGAAGLTLTEASAVILLEPALQSGIEQQAAGRIHRIGQGRAGRVVRLICQGTIEDKILRWQQHKAQADSGPLPLADLVRLLDR